MLKRLIIVSVILLFAGTSLAAPAGNTSDPKIPYGPGVYNMKASGLGPFKVSLDAESILKRDLKDDSNVSGPESSGQWYLLRIGYTFADRVEPYIKLGFSNLEASWKEYSKDIKVKAMNEMALGLGVKMLAFEIPEHRIRFSLDGQYRYTEPGIDEATVGIPNRAVSATEFEVSEWQVSGIVSMEFPIKYDKYDSAAVSSIIPYAGIGHANSNTTANFTFDGLSYNLSSAKNKDKFILIGGCDIISPENISLNVEGRCVGETSASGGCTVKF